jgi:antitoxin component of RelBE/YafQ-DinJ toxin-antitoxin module
MTAMVASAYVKFRVSLETKARMRELAERAGIPESSFVRQLLKDVLRTTAPVDPNLPLVREVGVPRQRLNLRLSSDDRRRLTERASARHMPSATYVVLLLRAHLHAAPPLPKAEYLALRQSVLELTTIGRNLNQIARALNQGDCHVLSGRAEVGAMLKVATALRDHFKALLKANEKSWSGRAESSS